MSTISFSVDDALKRDIAAWAKRANKSQSDLFREMYHIFKRSEDLDKTMRKYQKLWANRADELGLKDEDDIAEFLKNGR